MMVHETVHMMVSKVILRLIALVVIIPNVRVAIVGGGLVWVRGRLVRRRSLVVR